jgi:hypothetical protein
MTVQTPRALFFPDGLLVVHGGFPLSGEVAGLDDARERLANASMSRYDLDAVEDHDLVVAEEDLDGPPNEAVWTL